MATALETAAGEQDQQAGATSEGSQYLTFTLGDECYGVDILRVQEIKGYTAVTRIPNTPDFIKGVLNLRGTIVPIVDLRTKFGMEKADLTMFTVIVVVVVRDRVMGVIVDAVSDVLNIAAKDVQPPPAFGDKVDTNFIQSIAKSGDKLITLLDIDRVLSLGELAQAEAAAASA
ncbi:MAG: chemotaxis protein CheW [Nitrospirota bacterium]